jgi:2-(1,2-epoxy-1,2-dihydrophenyl)acetyl-CoA isomerase
LSWLLPRLVGLRRAQEIILLNLRVDGTDAVAMGLVTRCVALNELAAQGRELAEKLAATSSVALAGAKALLLEGADSPLELQLEREARSIAAAGGTVDGKEGVAAFLARRAPVFKTD